jgi:hypothetical protein
MFKRLVLTVMVLGVVAGVGSAQSEADRIQGYIKQLETKQQEAARSGDQKRVARLETMIQQELPRLSAARAEESGVQVAKAESKIDTQLADLQEETNKALADLKSQIDGVKNDNGDAKVGGLIRFEWTKRLEPASATAYNQFDIKRAYLDFKKKLAAGASARVTLDVARISGATKQNLFDYIKYAYVDLPITVPAGMPVSLTGIMGLQHTPWIDWSGKIWRFENIRSTFADAHKNSIGSSADFGLGAKGQLSFSGMPAIDYHATVLNGAGYANAENNSAKDIALRLNSDLLKTDLGTNAGSTESTQAGFLIALKNADYGNVYLETQTDTKSGKNVNGYSIGGFLYPAPELLPGTGLLARYDMYDADTSRTDRQTKTTVVGAFYDWGKNVCLSLDLTSSQVQTAAETKTAALRAQVNF